MPVPEELDWTAAGGVPEVVHHRPRRALHAGRADGRRAAARPRRRRRRRHGRRAARRRWPARASPRPCATSTRASRSPRSGVNAIAPEGFEEHGPFDVILELVGAPNLADEPRRARESRADLRHRRRRGREDRDRPARADGQARRGSTARRCAPARSRRRRPPRGWWRRAVLPGFASGDLSVPVDGDVPARRRRRRLRALPGRRASSARSCSRSERPDVRRGGPDPACGRILQLRPQMRRLLRRSRCWLLLALPAAAQAARPAPLRPKARPLARSANERLSNERTITRWAHTNLRGGIRAKPSWQSKAVGALRWNTEDGLPEVYLALASHVDPSGGQVWIKIRIPGRPNGRTGWVRQEQLSNLELVETPAHDRPPQAARHAAQARQGDLALADRRRRARHRSRRAGSSGSASGSATSAAARSTARGRSAPPPTRATLDATRPRRRASSASTASNQPRARSRRHARRTALRAERDRNGASIPSGSCGSARMPDRDDGADSCRDQAAVGGGSVRREVRVPVAEHAERASRTRAWRDSSSSASSMFGV